nr:class II heat shock protein [Tanacetum cinerariifolium]
MRIHIKDDLFHKTSSIHQLYMIYLSIGATRCGIEEELEGKRRKAGTSSLRASEVRIKKELLFTGTIHGTVHDTLHGTVHRFYISGLKVALQIELLRARPTTLGEAFSLARITETRFEDERSASAIAQPNDLNTRVHVQDLEETTRHKPNNVKAIKSSGSSLLVESKYYAANQVGLIFNQSNEAIYYERILELIAGQLCQYLCKHILDFGYDLQEANLQLKT